MVSRFRPIILGTNTIVKGTLDDEEVATYQQVMAHVTEVNGAQLQTNLFGKQYASTYVARCRGNLTADFVAFPKSGVSNDNLKRYAAVQVRKHVTRTDIFFANDREVNDHELE